MDTSISSKAWDPPPLTRLILTQSHTVPVSDFGPGTGEGGRDGEDENWCPWGSTWPRGRTMGPAPSLTWSSSPAGLGGHLAWPPASRRESPREEVRLEESGSHSPSRTVVSGSGGGGPGLPSAGGYGHTEALPARRQLAWLAHVTHPVPLPRRGPHGSCEHRPLRRSRVCFVPALIFSG